MIEIIMLALVFGQIREITPRNELKVKIQSFQEDTYYLLTKKQPLEIKVEGPTWLRVYTRIPWADNVKGAKIYKIILQENDFKEKFVTMETERSKSAKLDKVKLSKWRSFYINVPSGINSYRFIAWSLPGDSILVKFAHEAPKKWLDITPLEYNAKLQLVEDERIIDYFEITGTKSVVLEIEGPKKLEIISRLSFTMAMQGEQFFSVNVKEKNKIIKNSSFRAYRSETTNYHNRTEILPSNPHTFYLDIGKGKHRLEFNLAGGESCGLRFMIEQK